MAEEFVIERRVSERSHTRIKVSARALLGIIVGAGGLLAGSVWGIIAVESRTGLLGRAIERRSEPRVAITVGQSQVAAPAGVASGTTRVASAEQAQVPVAETPAVPVERTTRRPLLRPPQWTTTTSSLPPPSAGPSPLETLHVVRPRATAAPAGLTRACTPAIVRAGLTALRDIAGIDLGADGGRACQPASWDTRPKRGSPQDRIREGS